jgi:hypothetical protein
MLGFFTRGLISHETTYDGLEEGEIAAIEKK